MAHRRIDIDAFARFERDGVVEFAVHLDPPFEDIDEFLALMAHQVAELARAMGADAREDRDHPLLPQVGAEVRSEEDTSELQSLMRISYAVFCLKKKNKITKQQQHMTL